MYKPAVGKMEDSEVRKWEVYVFGSPSVFIGPAVIRDPSFYQVILIGTDGPKWIADRLDGGELVVFETVQTLLDLGHVTVLVKPFPKVYGLGLSEVYFG
ncbi:hypothetical protein CDL15_Pgr008334 [Punica granatum]|uniref:Uncharacterized protein n=1 Tax=Punica granatum TaxID=22663 RepID=A0A218XSU4_PUNGR|nr:hypothetical protein CDL15_Pgr008334 [Punica granatum]